MANYPQELAQDAVCQSHTGHMTGLWFLPARPLRLNTNDWVRGFTLCIGNDGRSQWPSGLRRGFAAARLLRLWFRIPPGTWMYVCCECCVLSGRGLCDELITRPEESYRLWCVVVCDLETSCMRRPWSTGEGGLLRQIKKYIGTDRNTCSGIPRNITIIIRDKNIEHRDR